MALREKVLKKKAQKFENKDLERITINKNQLFILERLLSDAYIIRRPKPNEYEHRKQLIRVFNEIAKELYGNDANCPVVEEFGSFSMDLFTTGSDLDLSINFKNSSNQLVFPRDQKIKTLRKFARKFYALQNQGYVRGVQPIVTAKVPILKVTDVGTEVECDLSVENRDGISKSAIIRLITSIDERFQKLSFLMKAWAKAHDINSSKDRTLNSLSIILLVAFHLQTRDPPILPPFSAILKGGHDLESVQTSVRNFRNYGSKNTETLGELFVSFLLKLSSVKILWPKGLCASPFSGHWISKTWDTKIASMSVEDFTDRTQNVARAVGKSEVEEIYRCINLTIQNLGLFMNSQISQLQLNKSFFGIDIMPHYPIDPKPNIPQQNYQQVKTTINPKPNVPQQNYQQVKTTINPKPNVPQQNYQQVKTTINPKPNILQQNYQQVKTTINPKPNILQQNYQQVKTTINPKPNAPQQNYQQVKTTINPKPNILQQNYQQVKTTINPKPNILQQNYQQVKTTINPKPNVPQQNYQQVKTTINPKPNILQQNYQQVKTTINPKPNILQQNYQQVKTTINPKPNAPQQNYQQVKTTINPKPNILQQNYQQVKTTINPKPNILQQNYQQVKTTINPKPNAPQQNYQQVKTTINPKPNILQQNYQQVTTPNPILTINPNPNSVIDLNWPPPTGHWPVQPVDHHPNKRMRVPEGVGGWGPGWVEPGWNQGWGATRGAGPQEIQNVEDSWGRRVQRPHNGNYSTYDDLIVESRVSSVSKCWCVSGLLLLALCLVVIAVYN